MRTPNEHPQNPPTTRPRTSLHWLIAGFVLTVLAASLLSWPFLSEKPLRSTEGHRIVPAVEVLESGELTPTTMFELNYVRKPPGMPWLIAGAIEVFGGGASSPAAAVTENRWIARAPSAICMTLMAICAWGFSSRWFGAKAGLMAGVLMPLTPAWWPAWRTAEIEPPLYACTLLGVLAAVHLMAYARAGKLERAGAYVLIVLGWGGALLLKGPVIAPVFGAAIIASTLVLPGSVRTKAVRTLAPLGALCLGFAPFAYFFLFGSLRAVAGEDAQTQGIGEFISLANLSKAVGVPFSMFIASVPASLALFFPFGPDAKKEIEERNDAQLMYRIARVLALTALIAAGIYLLAMTSKLRYALPASVTLAPLAGYVLAGACKHNGFFTAKRAKIARTMMLGSPIIMGIALSVGAGYWVLKGDMGRVDGTTLPAAIELAPAFEEGEVVWAAWHIDTQPDLLLELKARAGIRPLWKPTEVMSATLPPVGTALLLMPDEVELYSAAGLMAPQNAPDASACLVEITRARARHEDAVLVRRADLPAALWQTDSGTMCGP